MSAVHTPPLSNEGEGSDSSGHPPSSREALGAEVTLQKQQRCSGGRAQLKNHCTITTNTGDGDVAQPHQSA